MNINYLAHFKAKKKKTLVKYHQILLKKTKVSYIISGNQIETVGQTNLKKELKDLYGKIQQ